MHGRYEQRKPKKKGGTIVLVVLIVVIALLAAAIGGGIIYYNSMLNKINRAEEIEKDISDDELKDLGLVMDETEATTEPETLPETTVPETTVPETIPPMKPEDIINVLVIGQAARPGEEARMADSTMLVTLNKYTKTVTLTSVHRDTYVKYPQYKTGKEGRCKFTSAYAVACSKWDIGGGMEVMNLLMEQNFGVNVDYNFEVNFDMFIKFLDAMYGVEMELTEAEANYLNKELKKNNYPEYQPGYNSLDGFSALTYARMRKAEGDNDSDLKRTARQRYLVEMIIKKFQYILKEAGLPRVHEIINTVLPDLTTNMENSEITKLIADLLPMLPELKIEKGTIPVEGTGWGDIIDIYDDGIPDSILRFDPGQQKKLLAPITEGVFE